MTIDELVLEAGLQQEYRYIPLPAKMCGQNVIYFIKNVLTSCTPFEGQKVATSGKALKHMPF